MPGWLAPAVFLLCACAGPGAESNPDGALRSALGPLPAAARHASDQSTIDGANYDDVGQGAAVSGTSLQLDAAGIDAAWARYAFALPEGHRLAGLSLHVSDVEGEYWVALADYGTTRGWEWHGPYAADAAPSFEQPWYSYLSPAGHFYFVVLAAQGGRLLLDSVAIDHARFGLERPPFGEVTAAEGPCSSPSLAVISQSWPAYTSRAAVIAYTQRYVGPSQLYLAYYSGGAWRSDPLLPGHDVIEPRLRWLDERGEFILTAYDRSRGRLVDLRLSPVLAVKSVTDVDVSALPFVCQSLDTSEPGIKWPQNEVGVAHAYSDGSTGELYISRNDGTGWRSELVYAGERVFDAALCYNQWLAERWIYYIHGTMQNEPLLRLDTTLEVGRDAGAGWSFEHVPAAASPLSVVTPRFYSTVANYPPPVSFGAVANSVIQFPGGTVASLLYDLLAAHRSAGEWQSDVVAAGGALDTYDFQHGLLTLSLSAALKPSMVGNRSDHLLWTEVAGDVRFGLFTQVLQGGELLPAVRCKQLTVDTWRDSNYFEGSTGWDFSWDNDGNSTPFAAYLHAAAADPLGLKTGEFLGPGDLMYWSWDCPPPPPPG